MQSGGGEGIQEREGCFEHAGEHVCIKVQTHAVSRGLENILGNYRTKYRERRGKYLFFFFFFKLSDKTEESPRAYKSLSRNGTKFVELLECDNF